MTTLPMTSIDTTLDIAGLPHHVGLADTVAADDDDGLAGDAEDAPQPRADVRRRHPAAAVHGDVRRHLRWRYLRERGQLPARCSSPG